MIDRINDTGSFRVNRGGGWGSGVNFCKVGFVFYDCLDRRIDFFGFRVVKTKEAR
jgi:formylglycine-generating enzyme required for sulfatase activity